MTKGAGFFAQRIGTAPKPRTWDFKGWPRGANNFAQDNETRDTEFYQAENVEIVGKGSIRLPRRGMELFAEQTGAAAPQGAGVWKDPVTGKNELVVLIDGRFYKISSTGTLSEIDNTITWNATAKMRGVQVRESFYFGTGEDYLSKYDGSAITQWTAITNVDGVVSALTGSGTDAIYKYGVTAVTDVGETAVVSATDLNGPSTLDSSNYVTVTWNRKTASNVKGYNVWKSVDGDDQTLLLFVAQQSSGATMSLADKGSYTRSLTWEAPNFNSTGGVKGTIYASYADSIFISGNASEPDIVYYSGTGIYYESFSPSYNGGWIRVNRGDGEPVTALIGLEDYLVVFKETSIWKFVFDSSGNPTVTSMIPQYGTKSPDSVDRMENEIVFMGHDRRVRVLGYEPNILNVIRTADISNRIQDRLDGISWVNPENIFGIYFDQKYIVCDRTNAYPYDRRYIGFLDKWTNFTYTFFVKWDGVDGKEKLYGGFTGTGKIVEILVDGLYTDLDADIPAIFRPKRIDGGNELILKYFHWTKFKFLEPVGSVTIKTYKDGATDISTKAAYFSQEGGFGHWMFGEAMFGEAPSVEVTDSVIPLFKELNFEAGSVYHQIEVDGNVYNHMILQTMFGKYEYEDLDYHGESIVNID